MKRPIRIIFALVLAIGMTGLYWTGPDPDVCGDNCTAHPKLWVAMLIFACFALIGLRIAKKLYDWSDLND